LYSQDAHALLDPCLSRALLAAHVRRAAVATCPGATAVIAYPAGGDRGSPADALPGEEFVFVKAPPTEREALLHEDPATFFVTPHYANAPGVIVRLSRIDPDALSELLVQAWRTVAPKRLVKSGRMPDRLLPGGVRPRNGIARERR
jgi:hypothetical protein